MHEIFPSMDGLKTLNLSNTAQSWHLPSKISNLPNLESLNLFDALGLEKMGKCPFQKNNPIFCPTFQTN